jgi:hypothetical protein
LRRLDKKKVRESRAGSRPAPAAIAVGKLSISFFSSFDLLILFDGPQKGVQDKSWN